MIILDTNVISEIMKEEMDSNVQAWLNIQKLKINAHNNRHNYGNTVRYFEKTRWS